MKPVLDHCQGLAETAFEAGAVLIREGERRGNLFVLIEGEVEVLRGSVEVAVVSEPGALFGEMAALLDMAATASVVARSKVRAHVIDEADTFLRSHPEVTYHAARLLARRLRDATTYLVDIKQQFEDQSGHLSMVDKILESLMHQQGEDFDPDSALDDDPRL